MARAHTIWLVINSQHVIPVAAFTVKHEMESWVRHHYPVVKHSKKWEIWRCPDGRDQVPPSAVFVTKVVDMLKESDNEPGTHTP